MQSDKFSHQEPIIGLRITTEKSLLNYCGYLDVAIVVKHTFYKNDEIQHKNIDDIQRLKNEKEARQFLQSGKFNMILTGLIIPQNEEPSNL